jgi:hypothetical protein
MVIVEEHFVFEHASGVALSYKCIVYFFFQLMHVYFNDTKLTLATLIMYE